MDSNDREMLDQLTTSAIWSCESDYSEDDTWTEEIYGSVPAQMGNLPSVVSGTFQIPIMTEIVRCSYAPYDLQDRDPMELRLSNRSCPMSNQLDDAQRGYATKQIHSAGCQRFQVSADRSTYEYLWRNGIYHHLYNVQDVHDPTRAKKFALDSRQKKVVSGPTNSISVVKSSCNNSKLS